MEKELSLKEILERGDGLLLPSLSVDCVIFGYYNNQLKVLLVKQSHSDQRALPGGFVYRDEDVNAAASRVLESRTGLKNIFLKQFHLFGDASRTREQHARELLMKSGIKNVEDHWLLRRFATLGFYALVEFEKVGFNDEEISKESEWTDLDKLPKLIIDHKQILDKALETIRYQLNYQPIGYNLVAEEFTIKDLQSIYETILCKKLDRRNFQRKILSYGILERKEKKFTGKAHKAPYLYSFNKEKYFEALQDGLYKIW
jgi:8-oxo-dGTP diphosphatase